MPIYEYQCHDCKQLFEEWQKDFSERTLECPVCGGKSDRLISHTSFVLKGGGWYAQGYGSTGGETPAGGNGSKETAKPAESAAPAAAASSPTSDAS